MDGHIHQIANAFAHADQEQNADQYQHAADLYANHYAQFYKHTEHHPDAGHTDRSDDLAVLLLRWLGAHCHAHQGRQH